MVTSYSSPVSGFPVIGPSKGGRVSSVLIMAAAAAPAFWAWTARAIRAHPPRVLTASWLAPDVMPLDR